MITKGYSSISLFKLYRKGHGLLHIAKYKLKTDPTTHESSVTNIALNARYRLDTIPFSFITEQKLTTKALYNYASTLITFEKSAQYLAEKVQKNWKGLLSLSEEENRIFDQELLLRNLTLLAECTEYYPKISPTIEQTDKSKYINVPTRAIVAKDVFLPTRAIMAHNVFL